MYCEGCKEKLATVHVAQIINGQKVELHLCETCAAGKGALMFDLGNTLSISHLLGSLLGNPYEVQDLQTPSSVQTCPSCGMSFASIKHTGKLGCSQCYTAFEQELEPTLRRINGNSQHVGKIPSRSGQQVLLKRQIDELKTRLHQAVSKEQYEEAAEIRDSLKDLEKNLE
ncbi:MAG TPA: UvrB/UvrC motif-containing protein [Syntrophomonadaceae bacterium]|nr:UvrB/UvrC motif-containing protein [Syntrophomonadaceae bacterium]